MTPRRLYSILLLAIAISGCKTVAPSNEQVVTRPPVAKRVPHVTTIHGERLVDNYFWLRKKNNPAVLAYLQAEDAYTDLFMGPTKPFPIATVIGSTTIAPRKGNSTRSTAGRKATWRHPRKSCSS